MSNRIYFLYAAIGMALVVWPRGVQAEKAESSPLAPVSIRTESASITRAIELAEKGKDEEAIRVCDELIRKGDFNARLALEQKGACLYRLGRFSDACVCWELMLNGRMPQAKDEANDSVGEIEYD